LFTILLVNATMFLIEGTAGMLAIPTALVAALDMLGDAPCMRLVFLF
jgi:hypothetical protein